MPHPSARTKHFSSLTKLKLSRTKILTRAKKSIFLFKSHWNWNFWIGRGLKIYFQQQIFILNDFWKQKMDFSTLDKIFVPDNSNIVLEKIILSRQMDKALLRALILKLRIENWNWHSSGWLFGHFKEIRCNPTMSTIREVLRIMISKYLAP